MIIVPFEKIQNIANRYAQLAWELRHASGPLIGGFPSTLGPTLSVPLYVTAQECESLQRLALDRMLAGREALAVALQAGAVQMQSDDNTLQRAFLGAL